ncbi:class I SAM-dependent methyltransferase [Actinomadura barringtoniae]|uniref:Class I SAM-dependent methyltransferase n=1 Tax=Actinomadura barringtoniae TaxID=1427535 RepID=A0A939PKV0_9ACTN|nr:class I SAM-dependent methyltransferase [Actinomadura barringtoniae]MBO2454646.1 class I SAM-dependent methyltransferase [Actinomadura barringtoniae]
MTETATREAYDGLADTYAELFTTAFEGNPLDRGMHDAFAELVTGAIADLGCGPGRVTAYLHSRGLDVFGMDLSPRMVTLARQAYPDLRFEQGSMTGVPVEDASLGGIVARYSVIHTQPEELPVIFAEFARVLAPGGHLLISFYAHDGAELAEPFDHKVTRAYRLSPDGVAGLLAEAGLKEIARLERQPNEGERFLQGCLLLRKDPAV